MMDETIDENNIEENYSIEPKRHGFFKEVFKFALIATLIVLPIRIFIAQPFIVSGESMSPTFLSGEYLIVDEISYRFNEPQRGDVVIFKYPKDLSKFFIKRIIALPGENIEMVDGNVFISSDKIERTQIIEKYLGSNDFNNLNVTLGSDEYYVMGDNRHSSLDSRSWGPLSKDLIRGKAFLRLLPISKSAISPGRVEYIF